MGTLADVQARVLAAARDFLAGNGSPAAGAAYIGGVHPNGDGPRP